jgi:hypothetical protein
MPSFYPLRNSPRQPLTPPEFVPSYQTGCGGMPYQQTYSGQPGVRQCDDGYDFADRYGQLAIAMPPMYPQSGTYNGHQSFSRHSYNHTALPPMRMQYDQPAADTAFQQQQQQRAHEESQRVINQAPPKEEKPVGGVSAKLDYDMNVMADFVTETALSIITPGRMMPPSFRKWVNQVLCATRLPSATILLSMFYLSSRMPMLNDQPKTDSQLYRLLTIALVLGSKFLDDNTFINRSWSEVSGIAVADLNRLETEWLVAISFKLHRDPQEQSGWTSWSEHWQEYQAHAAARATRTNKLSPLDTAVHRRSVHMNQNKPLPPLPTQRSYTLLPPPYEYTPKSGQTSCSVLASYNQYDMWHSANEYSPASAPTTGPTTPEHTGALNSWTYPRTQTDDYSRRSLFGYSAQPQAQPAASQPPQHYGPPAYSAPYNNSLGWSPPWSAPAHDYNCRCYGCYQRNFMGPLPHQAVAA